MRFKARFGVLVLAAVLATLLTATGVAAAGNTLRIEAPSVTVAKGSSFTVRIVQNASVATGGTQASLTFDKSRVQITSATRGSVFGAAAINQPTNLASAVSAANTSGKLATIASAFLPPDSVAPGDIDFLTVTFMATACGSVTLGLPIGPTDATMLDGRDATFGNTVPVTTTGGTVNITCAGAPSAPIASSSVATPGAVGTARPGSSVAPSPTAAATLPDSNASPTATLPSDPTADPTVTPSATGGVGQVASSDGGGPGGWVLPALVGLLLAGGGLAAWRSRRPTADAAAPKDTGTRA